MKKALSIFLTALILNACGRSAPPEVTRVSLDEGTPDVNCYAAVRFAESAKEKPAGVFAIDSPLDIERFYRSTRRDVLSYRKGLDEGDSTYVDLMRDVRAMMGGEPEEVIGNYYDISPYSLSDSSHRAILPLMEIPVRVYIEPAEQWWLDNRGTDVFGLNILDATAFINDLRLLGNARAELIVTSGRGTRNGSYHPHSWTIVEDKELVRWMKMCSDCEKQPASAASFPEIGSRSDGSVEAGYCLHLAK